MTEQTKHTPGPWSSDWQFIVANDPNGVHPDIYIAEISESDDEGRVASDEQQQANARLIAAAPELLKALEDALAYMVDYKKCQNEGLLNDMRAAIAKAKGAA